MEFLFDIFSNPIALFILIGVISSLFKDKSKDQNKRRPVRPAQPAPPITRPEEPQTNPRYDRRRGMGAEDTREVYTETGHGHKGNQTSPVTDGPELLNDIQKIYQERKRDAEEYNGAHKPAGKGRMNTGASGGRLRQKREQQEPQVSFQPDRDTLIEGLIWAEVLGKPRAKKPYHPARRS